MIPDNLIFINAAPVDKYFQWQEEVMINNFHKYGIKNIQVIVWCPESRSEELMPWLILQKKYPDVGFHFYPDRGVNLGLYIPQLRPNILKQHFAKHPELKDKIFFYHDSDILFNDLPDFEKLVEGDICWQSDTSSYLDYNYLRRKEIEGNIPENEAIQVLTDIGRVSIDTLKSYNNNTGGAQYILKGIDTAFWEDIEKQVLEIRNAFFFGVGGSINKKYFPNENAGFQSWCADMWAINFALWNRGKITSTTPLLDFSWGTNDYETYKKKPIFHLAGVASPMNGEFYKGEWIQESPIGSKRLNRPRKDSATYAYWEAIKETEKEINV